MPLQEVGDKGGTEGRFSLHGVLEASSGGTLIPSISSPLFNSWASLVAGKESTCNAGDLGSIPGLGRSTEEGKGNPLQYAGLENSMDCVYSMGSQRVV